MLKALDLFCGAGGVTKGLQRAGFRVTGVDIKTQPRYCGDVFIQADATNPPVDLREFDFIWASPPCQAYSTGTRNFRMGGKVYPDLIAPTRALLLGLGCWAIENVPGAPIRVDLMLNGAMFPGLKTIKRRHFELSWGPMLVMASPTDGLLRHGWRTVTGHGNTSWMRRYTPVTSADADRAAMGIDWMTRDQLSQAIPPAYSEFIGREAVRRLSIAKAA